MRCRALGSAEGWKESTYLLVLESVQPGIKFLLLEAQVVHLVKLFGVFLRLHHQVPAHLSDLLLPRREGREMRTVFQATMAALNACSHRAEMEP